MSDTHARCGEPVCEICDDPRPSLPAGAGEPLDGEAIAAEWKDRSETIERLAKAYSALVMEARTLRSTLDAREQRIKELEKENDALRTKPGARWIELPIEPTEY